MIAMKDNVLNRQILKYQGVKFFIYGTHFQIVWKKKYCIEKVNTIIRSPSLGRGDTAFTVKRLEDINTEDLK